MTSHTFDQRKFDLYLLKASNFSEDYAKGYELGLTSYFHGNVADLDSLKLDEHCGSGYEFTCGYKRGLEGGVPGDLHGNVGNSSARKGEETKDTIMKFRVSSTHKERFRKAANKDSISGTGNLSEWALKVLLKASNEFE